MIQKFMRLLTLAVLLLLAAGCGKPSHRVEFKPALVSVDLGEGWQVLDNPTKPPTCAPRLVSEVGMMSTLLLERQTDVQKAADFLQEAIVAASRVEPNSLKQEPFTTDSGLTGIHISYLARTEKTATAPDTRSHDFVFRNRQGQCVSVNYTTSPRVESPAILEAIRKTLRVE